MLTSLPKEADGSLRAGEEGGRRGSQGRKGLIVALPRLYTGSRMLAVLGLGQEVFGAPTGTLATLALL